eukprot:3358711-Pleurochrysis_carterae.AAC.1
MCQLQKAAGGSAKSLRPSGCSPKACINVHIDFTRRKHCSVTKGHGATFAPQKRWRGAPDVDFVDRRGGGQEASALLQRGCAHTLLSKASDL